MTHLTPAQSYAYCERVARRQAANFYPAFRVLPRPQRRAMCALYAFMRITDDLVDDGGDVEVKRAKLAAWRDGFRAAMRGEDRHQVHPALRDTVERYAIPTWYLEAVIDGVEMDLEPVRFRRFAELYRYCFLVASVVGLACIHVWGFGDESAKQYAEHAGVAFQLTNILRDLGEDLSRGRVYLPAEDFALFGCAPEKLRETAGMNPAARRLLRYEADRARQYYQSAERLLPLLSGPGRAVCQVMLRIYRGLLDEIERRDYDVFSERVSLSGWRKAGLVLRAIPVRWGWTGR
jgi:phytoene synthase